MIEEKFDGFDRHEVTTEEILENLERGRQLQYSSCRYQNFDLKERLETLKRWRDLSSRSQLPVGCYT